jgi:hypothetical protein
MEQLKRATHATSEPVCLRRIGFNDGEFQYRISTRRTTMLARTLTALALATTLAAAPGTAEAGHIKQIKEKLQEIKQEIKQKMQIDAHDIKCLLKKGPCTFF